MTVQKTCGLKSSLLNWPGTVIGFYIWYYKLIEIKLAQKHSFEWDKKLFDENFEGIQKLVDDQLISQIIDSKGRAGKVEHKHITIALE